MKRLLELGTILVAVVLALIVFSLVREEDLEIPE